MKLFAFCLLLCCVFVSGCNSIYVKPGTFDNSKTVYTDRGGYTMRRSVKERMEARGYNVVVGKMTSDKSYIDESGDTDIEVDYSNPMGARYVVKVRERREKFMPVWCLFNGFWWWNFNMSISDQQTGEELLSWRGRGCANSSLRKLDNILNEMEVKNEQRNETIDN